MSDDRFRRSEDQYYVLKGQLASGRITPEQFNAALQDLIVQDAQSRYWMIGAESGKWYVHDGQNWVEAQPYVSAASVAFPAPPSPPMQAPPHTARPVLWIAGCGCALTILLGVIAAFFALSQGLISPSFIAAARATLTPLPPNVAVPTPVVTPTSVAAPTSVVAPISVVAPTSIAVPTTDPTSIALGILATATANARATTLLDASIATRVSASLTAAAPVPAPTVFTPTRPATIFSQTPVPTSPPGPQKKLEPILTTSVTGIRVVNLATGAAQQIYGEPNIACAAWSPDGSQVLLSSDLSGRRALRTLYLADNLVNDLHVEAGKAYNTGAQEALWSPDGTRVFVRNVTIPHSNVSLMLFDSGGKLLNSVERRLDKEVVPLFWSVDGKWVIALAAMPDPSPTLKYTLYAEEIATLSDARRKTVPEWQQYQQSIGASDRVFDERYWPWVERSAPITCSTVDFFTACP